jgi:hypothetical protein
MTDKRNLVNGSLTATTTAVPVSTSTLPIEDAIIQNDPANTVNILLGDATAQTIKVVPGASFSIEIDYINKVYVKTESGTATVNYLTGAG